MSESLAVGRRTEHGTLPAKGQWELCLAGQGVGGMRGRMGGCLRGGGVKEKESGKLLGRLGRLRMRD